MATEDEVKMLLTALQKGRWHLECHPSAPDVQPETREVLGFLFDGSKLILNIKMNRTVEMTVTAKINGVRWENQSGSTDIESRRFAISSGGFSEDNRHYLQAGVANSHWRPLDEKTIGLIFVRNEKASPGRPALAEGLF